jgi:hypothetical protein
METGMSSSPPSTIGVRLEVILGMEVPRPSKELFEGITTGSEIVGSVAKEFRHVDLPWRFQGRLKLTPA